MGDKLNLVELECAWTGKTIRAYHRNGTNDLRVLEACIVHDEYNFAKLLPPLGGNQRVAIDLGAHIGGATLALISAGYFVRAIEPIPDNVAMLRKNLALNGWDKSCAVHPEAAGAKGSKVAVSWGGAPNGGDRALERHRFIGSVDGSTESRAHSVEVTTVSVPELIRRHNVVDVIKTDCEGGEWDAFSVPRGTSKSVLDKISLVIGECHGGKTNADMLSILGKGFVDKTAEAGMDPNTYIVAARKERKACPKPKKK